MPRRAYRRLSVMYVANLECPHEVTVSCLRVLDGNAERIQTWLLLLAPFRAGFRERSGEGPVGVRHATGSHQDGAAGARPGTRCGYRIGGLHHRAAPGDARPGDGAVRDHRRP